MSDRYEDNDSRLSASPLGNLQGVGSIVNLSIDDEDWFQFNLATPGTASSTIGLDFLHADGDVDLELLNASGNIVGRSTGTSNSESISLNGFAAGTYFIRAYGYNGAANPNYSLNFNLPGTRLDDSFENNDDRNSATNLQTLSAPRLLSGLTVTDNDWFRFTTAATGTSGNSIQIDFRHADGDVDMQLLDSNGSVISTANGVGNRETISLDRLAAGTYYAHIYGYSGATNPYYDLTITPPGIQADRFEENDTQAIASNLGTLTNAIALSDLSLNDPDWFQFTTTNIGSSGDVVQIDFLHADGDIDMRLVDASGNTILSSTGVGDRETISLDGLAAGTYFVQVYGYNGAVNPNYTLSLTPPSNPEDLYEENDTQASVVPASAAAHLGTIVNSTTISNLSITDDDWFQFTTLATGSFDSFVQIDFSHSDGDVDIRLVNANGNVIASSTGVGNRETISLNGLAAGNYYVQIYGYNGATNPSYSLTIVPPPNSNVILPDAFEVNDTRATATNLRTLSGSNTFNNLTVHQSNNEDWHQFTIAADGSIANSAQLNFNGELGDLDFELYDQDGVRLDGSYGVGNQESVSLNGLIAGNYFLRVYGYSGATHPNYSLTIDAPTAPPLTIPEDVAEQNDTRAQAYQLRYQGGYYDASNLNLTMDDSANEPSRQDWFKFNLPANGIVGNRVAIEFDHALGDLDMVLFDNSGTQIGSSMGTGNQESISLAGEDAGDYYIQVYGYRNTSNPSYRLIIDGPTPSANIQPDTFEVNNTLAAATDLRQISGTGNVWQNLNINAAADQDWFKFTTVGAGTANDSVQLSFNHAAGDLALTLYNSSGTQISQSNGSIDRELVSLQGLAAGTYYAQVTGVGGATNPNYTLGINAPTDATSTLPNWTILVYLDADNDLERFGVEDLNEMEVPILPNGVRVVTLVDRIGGSQSWNDTSNGNWTDTRRGLITHDTNTSLVSSSLTSVGELNMGAPQTLTDFIRWGVQNNPAQNYGLILWNHGAGLPGVTWDDTNSGDNLSLREITQAVQASGQTFDLIGFDACLQAMVEQGYELRNLADVMVASQKVEPGDGWDYTAWLNQLAANPNMTAEQLGSAIVTTYGTSYNGAETLSATRVGNYAPLKSAIDTFATTALSVATNADWQAIAAARNTAAFFSETHYRDLKTFTDAIAGNNSITAAIRTAAQNVSTALTNAVIRNHSGSREGGTGLSIYLPEFGQATYTAATASFYTDTSWFNFLNQQRSVGRSRTSNPDWAEANEVRSQAYNLQRLAGANKRFTNLNIATSQDVDWFRFETANAGTTSDSAQIAFNSANGALKLEIFDAAGTSLQTSTTSTSGNNTIEQVNLNTLPTGQYFLKVSGISGSTNAYDLTINAPQTATIIEDWAERNDSREQAYRLGTIDRQEVRFPGLTMDGTANEAVREDWFVMTPNRGTEWNPNQVSIEFDNNQGNLDLYLYDANGTAINPAQGATNNSGETVALNTVAGQIYVRVAGRTSTTTNPDYTLVFRSAQPIPNAAPTVQPATFSIAENTATGTRVGNITATDPEGQTLTYAIAAGNADFDGDGTTAFGINSATGELTVTDSHDVDFERRSSFALSVSAQDSEGQSSTATATINLTNIVGGRIQGTRRPDRLIGDDTNDTIIGGFGNDNITTAGGRDRIVFDINRPYRQSAIGVDTITDFDPGFDRLVLDKTTFTAIEGRQVSFASVKTLRQAQRSNALITYVRSTGALYYNQNKSGGGFGIGGQFAALEAGVALTARQFVLQS